MPWHLVEGHADCGPDAPWAVVKDSDGTVAGCHATREEAAAQLQALYAQEGSAYAAGLAAGIEAALPRVRAQAQLVAQEAATAAATPCACQGDHGAVTATLATLPMREAFPVPEYPPSEWFEGPPTWVAAYRAEHGLDVGIDPATGEDMSHHLTVTDDGRVGGYFFQRGTCLTEGPGECWQPPPSATGYTMFHQQDVVTNDGHLLKVGVIGNVHGHASPFVGPAQAQKHYADPSAQMIVCRAGDDTIGGWIAGAMVPGSTYADVALVRRCALSGDWRPMDPNWFKQAGVRPTDPIGYDCVGPTLVNRPGLPLIRKYARAASAPVYLGGLGGVQLEAQEVPMIVQRPDGTTVELSNEELGQAVTSYLEARQAAELPEGEGEPTGDGEATATQLANHEERIAALEAQLENVLLFVEETMSREMAAIEASVLPLPPARVEDVAPAAS